MKFMEAFSNMINLQEVVTPTMVSAIIKYIYVARPAHGFDLQVYGPMDDAYFYNFILELYRHADFFQVITLKNAIIKELNNRLKASSEIIFDGCLKEAEPEKFKKALHDPMTGAIFAFDTSNVYYDFYEPLRAEIFHFVEICYPVLSRMGDDFHAYLRKAPELSIEILKKIGEAKDSMFLAPGPEASCMFCDETICANPILYFVQPEFGMVVDSRGKIRYFCSRLKCIRQIKAKDFW
ncbi:hypothetical protein N8I77_008879 [Diaporthe amygdali]|uniref:Uncharacterized protein n=1 Tax=Phomopsis amygdali TaxID=1214568 RepID=A0AAD9SA74_PHOAM|nr:hypothetical protein N8I77_008879 [Diaporthe amygdali]